MPWTKTKQINRFGSFLVLPTPFQYSLSLFQSSLHLEHITRTQAWEDVLNLVHDSELFSSVASGQTMPTDILMQTQAPKATLTKSPVDHITIHSARSMTGESASAHAEPHLNQGSKTCITHHLVSSSAPLQTSSNLGWIIRAFASEVR